MILVWGVLLKLQVCGRRYCQGIVWTAVILIVGDFVGALLSFYEELIGATVSEFDAASHLLTAYALMAADILY
jgi:hypothetical protein